MSDTTIRITEEPARIDITERPAIVEAQQTGVEIITVAVPGLQGPPGQGLRRTRIVWTIADWTGPEGGFYYLDLYHGLEDFEAVPTHMIDADGQQILSVDTITNDTANRIRCRVPAEPDGRIAGSVVIIGGLIE